MAKPPTTQLPPAQPPRAFPSAAAKGGDDRPPPTTVTVEPKLRRPIGCPEPEALRCHIESSEAECSASPCCAWTSASECIAIDHHRQVWVGFAAHRNGLTNQYMTYLKYFSMVEHLLNFLEPRWDLCVVLPRVLRSVLPPLRREDMELDGTIDGPWSLLFSVPAAAAFLQRTWQEIGDQGRNRPRRLYVFDEGPHSVPLMPMYAGRVSARGDWYFNDPGRSFLREQTVLGHEWVPDAKFQTCEGGGYKSLTADRARGSPLFRPKGDDTAPYAGYLDVAQRLLLKLPYRALAGEGVMVHTMFTCGPVFEGSLITRSRVDALAPGSSPTALARPVVEALRSLSQTAGGEGRYGAMHIRLEQDWVDACDESHSEACLTEKALPEVPRCLMWKNVLEKVLYVATGEETARTRVFRAFQLYMARYHGVTVVSKFDLGDEVADIFRADDDRFGRFSREEQATAEYAIVHQASSFLGWAVGTTFSWVQVLRLAAIDGKTAFFLSDDCPGMKAEKYMQAKPFHKGYKPYIMPPRPTADRAAQADWDNHYDDRARLQRWEQATLQAQQNAGGAPR